MIKKKKEEEEDDDQQQHQVMRFDHIFSYWIFIWWILYQMKLTTFNPKLLLIIASIYMIIVIVIKTQEEITNNNNNNKKKNYYCHTLPFSIAVCILKLYPLYTLRNSIIQESDIYFTFLFFLIYLSWLVITNGVKKVCDFYLFSLPNTLPPFEYYFNKVFYIKC